MCPNSEAMEEAARSHHAKTRVPTTLAARTMAKSRLARGRAARISWKLSAVLQLVRRALVHGEEENRTDSAMDNVTAARSAFSACVALMAMAKIIIVVPWSGSSSAAKPTDGQP